MSRKHVFWMAILSLLLVVPAAHAAAPGSWVLSANGGMSMPMGDFGDEDLGNADTGFQFGGAVDYVINEMFAVGVDGSWNQNKHGGEGETLTYTGGTAVYDKDTYKTWQVGVHGKYMIPAGTSPVSPFLLAGAGMYSTKEEWEGTITPTGGSPVADNDEFDFGTNFGFKVGAGAGFKANEQVTIGVQGDFNFIMIDKEEIDSDSLQYLGINAFVAWAIMAK